MGSLATSIGASATALNAALDLFELAAGWSGVGTIFFAAADAFIIAGTAIGQTALSTAAGSSTLQADLKCAIFSAIVSDGYVTPANFATVLSNINAISYGTPGIVGLIHDYVSNLGYAGIANIQAEGTLYAGDCSACAGVTWCWLMDFGTGSQHGWSIPGGLDGSWAGDSWVGTADSGGGFVHNEIDIIWAFPHTHLTSISFVYASTAADTHSNTFIHALRSGSTVQSTNITPTADGANHTATFTFSSTDIDQVYIRFSKDGTGGTCRIRSVTFHGPGANPFGTSNCT